MTKWRPDPSQLRRPAYLSLAEQIANAITDGKLTDGTQLPPHRKLADDLHLSVQTVSRAYDELIRRGLISGEIGRGSFVQTRPREPEPPYLPERLGEVIDLSILKPVCEQIHLERLRQAFGWLSENLPSSSALSFRPNMVFPRHRAVATEWLARCGLEISPLNISVTNGATSGMTVALMSVAPPGSTVATEAISHHTLVPLSTYLGLHLEGLAIDEEGMIPDALDEACRKGPIRAIFLQPSVINPMAALMSAERRQALATVAAKHDIAIIENDILGPMVENRAPPMAAFAPERTLYVTSFTKITVPGLRIGYLTAPDRYVAAVANRHLVSNWMATPAMAEIATRWVSDGTAMELVNWQRRALLSRHAIAAEMLAGQPYRAHPQSLHVWLPLSGNHTEDGFVSQARLRGVAIAPGKSFHTTDQGWTPAVRISLGSTTESELRTGLGIVASLAQGNPQELLLAI
ncbi:PLP-dependent aminotransferase family protein [Rhizobium leguminosarum]|uniref:Transcriptional regulator, GntR family with aminotransferase domain n=1 Tax=Rhizobium leguminosarum bv. trifolii (strain WSM1325) TaxID=395491 RepID=C6B5T3_RHILS|nr:PLP-dependent aminotransferase family protein [Rhizobium leguminosarum]ACS59441.1 transcriptional regulator, GntR family with aminotransferase domain [Rhizobium leguminosarum bv. trifolii WSM1325]MBY2911262.1 PLP-dependent aminotransferase family protein [Rhizobium leguminosarum]MBY2944723.1 PLP-dependent aminotransferase family protein [Rhizobium leguminosarum]MBY2951331.1 PLP-dependent aminotransferase family protein [Rhizobium leguminosarum]MBY2996262.1 PLP-dependent aminotransferase fam